MSNKLSLTKRPQSGFKARFGPSGVLLFERTTGLNVLLDEVVPAKKFWSTAPRQISIALTNACDLTCSYCYAPKTPSKLKFDDVVGWLGDLDANGCMGIGFGGGEPTLYPRLAELCSHTTKHTTLAVTMTTHAHHLSEPLLDKLSGNIHFVRVSMDGVGSTYESIRHRSFVALIERISALREIVRFGINFVVSSTTVHDLQAATDLASHLGASEFLLLPEEPTGRTKGIDKETVRALEQFVMKYRGGVPLSVSASRSDGLPICDPLNAESGLTAFAHVDASGVVKRTSYDRHGILIGNTSIITAIEKLNTLN